MKTFLPAIALWCAALSGYSQAEADRATFKEIADEACKCVDSVKVSRTAKTETAKSIHACLDKHIIAIQLKTQMAGLKLDDKTLEHNITLNSNPDSKEYKKLYYRFEAFMMDDCPAMKEKISSNEIVGRNSISSNRKAIEFYSQGQDLSKNGDFEGAIKNYKKAIAIDPDFAFAYDNMGLCYRKINDFDNAILCYEKSIELNPSGETPLQNLAVAYQHKKEYRKSAKTYEKLAKLNASNPEVYYGLGQLYGFYLDDIEKGLDNLCKAYNLYVEHKSPYRTDAEKSINYLRAMFNEKGKQAKFDEILARNKISAE